MSGPMMCFRHKTVTCEAYDSMQHQSVRLDPVSNTSTSGGSPASDDRRAFLQKSLVATGIAWTAPVVMSLRDPIAAATGSGGCPYTFCFDDGTTEGWTIDNTAGDGNGLWNVDNGRSTSPTFALHYGTGVGGDYDTGGTNSGTVTSPAFVVPAAGGDLDFNLYRDIEDFATGTWDEFSVSVLPGGTVLYAVSADGGTNGLFEPISLSLAAFAGTAIQIVFSFATGDANFNNFEGIWVDDVTIPCDAPPAGGGGTARLQGGGYFPERPEPNRRAQRERARATR